MATLESLKASGVPEHLGVKALGAGIDLGWLEQLWTLLKQAPTVACPILAVLVPQLSEPYRTIAAEVQTMLCPAPTPAP